MTIVTATGRQRFAEIVIALFAFTAPSAATAQTDWRPDTATKAAIRAEIEALSIEYYYRIDHGEAESVVDLFTEDGLFHPGGSKPIVGRPAIRAYYAARSKSWVTRHVTTNLRLTYIDADHVEAVRLFTHYMGDRADGAGPYPAIPSVGEYQESIVRGADGRWRYASRVASALFARRP